MPAHLIRKLEQFARFSPADRSVLEAAASAKVRRFGPREDVVREGDAPDHVNLFLEGWGCRYKTLEDGRRQIISFFLPGDMCDLNIFILDEMDHSIATLTAARVAEISRQTLHEITAGHSRITQALWWETLVEVAVQRERTVSLGQRSATERLAHLLCELYLRLEAVGLTDGGTCDLPVTQADLADALGLSTVHVNRTLQELRGNGLIRLRGRELAIPDFPGLQNVAMFNPNYLHVQRRDRVAGAKAV